MCWWVKPSRDHLLKKIHEEFDNNRDWELLQTLIITEAYTQNNMSDKNRRTQWLGKNLQKVWRTKIYSASEEKKAWELVLFPALFKTSRHLASYLEVFTILLHVKQWFKHSIQLLNSSYMISMKQNKKNKYFIRHVRVIFWPMTYSFFN